MVQKLWSNAWKGSSQARKQRKYVFNAPLNIRHKMLGAPLSAELRKEYGMRSVPVRKGDTVTITTGQFKSKNGKVEKVSLSKIRVFVEGAVLTKADGSTAMYPIHPSNVKITKLDLSDKRRAQKLDARKKEAKK